MLQPSAYPAAIARYGVDKLTENQRKAHDIILEGSANFTDWDLLRYVMDEPTIRQVVESWLARLDELTSAPPTPAKKQRTPTQRAKAKADIKRGRGKKAVKKTQKQDGQSFAARMKAARDAKKQASAPAPVDLPATSAPKAKKAKATKNDQNAPKAAKPVKTPTLKPTDQAYLNAGHVLVLPVEAKHFKKYVALSQKGTKEQLVAALNALQRDIQKKVLRKTDKNSALLMQIQREYLALLDTKKSPYRPGHHLADVQTLAEGTKVYKSVEIMLAVIGWNEQDKTAEQCKKLLSTIRNAKAKGKIKSTDPYAGEVDALQAMLEKATSGRKFLAEQVDLAGLRGLAGLAGLGSVPVSPVPAVVPVAAAVPAVMSAVDMQNLKYDTYRLTGRWLSLLGLVSKNFKLMIWGEPGQGKSTLAMQLARYLASDFAPVLYCSSEEYPSYTLNDKLKRVGGAVQGWDFSNTISALTPRHKFLVLDSVSHFGWTLAELKALALARPDLSIILVFHATKGGDFKGGKDWEHEVDTVIHAYAPGQAKTTKNRFAALAEVTTF